MNSPPAAPGRPQNHATPLLALDAVAIDTETTGLDPRKAWIVEIAGVKMRSGRPQPGETFRRLVQPGQPIPRIATGIHGIDDAAVSQARTFGQVFPELLAFTGRSVVIGHVLGFDLAVLKRECERAGVDWKRPRTLDTRLLAEAAEPDLPDYSLEGVAAWLGVEIKDRHSALGDALACARIFCALVPKLRLRGIRTLAEAESACRALTDALGQQRAAGWLEAVEAPIRADSERTLGRIDSYPYRHRVRDVMRNPPRFVAVNETVREVLARLMAEQISSVFVSGAQASGEGLRPDESGIVTERDLLRAVALNGAGALDMPVERFMSAPLITVPAEAFVYRAIGRMSRRKIRHLGAVDDQGAVVGALSARDLLRLRAGEAISIGDEIEQAEDVHALAAAWARLPQVAAALLQEQVLARDVAAVISRELGALTRQAARLAEMRMRQQGLGGPPCAYAIAVLGSAGRSESLLSADQDNALFFADGEPGEAEDRWFAKLSELLSDILHEVGPHYCKGGVMAKNPQWRGSVSTWRERISGWIGRSNPRDLMSVDIFFDLRPVSGDAMLAQRLRNYAFDVARGQPAFAKLLVESGGTSERGINFLGSFRTENGRIDLKKTGMFALVSTARALAICHHVMEHSTPGRLAGVKGLGLGGERDLAEFAKAYDVFLDLVLRQQIADLERGVPASNKVEIGRLSQDEQMRLRKALRAVEGSPELTRDLLFGS